MYLSPTLEKAYCEDKMTAREAQRKAEWIAFGPVVFQASRIMLKWGILDMLRDADGGMTMKGIVERTGKSEYAIKVLMEAALCIGTVMLGKDKEHFELTKTGWCLITDELVRVNMAFNHDVNYGMVQVGGVAGRGKTCGIGAFWRLANGIRRVVELAAAGAEKLVRI